MTDVATAGSRADGPTIEARESKLSQGAAALAAGRRRAVLRNPHVLLAAAATLTTVGIVAILLAWLGIARSTMVEEQMAYLVSGGLLGLALATIGGLAFFSHWLLALIRATREQTELLRELLAQGADADPKELTDGGPRPRGRAGRVA